MAMGVQGGGQEGGMAATVRGGMSDSGSGHPSLGGIWAGSKRGSGVPGPSPSVDSDGGSEHQTVLTHLVPTSLAGPGLGPRTLQHNQVMRPHPHAHPDLSAGPSEGVWVQLPNSPAPSHHIQGQRPGLLPEFPQLTPARVPRAPAAEWTLEPQLPGAQGQQRTRPPRTWHRPRCSTLSPRCPQRAPRR